MAEIKWSEVEKRKRHRERQKQRNEVAGKNEKEDIISNRKRAQNDRKLRQRAKLRKRRISSPTSPDTSSPREAFGSRQSRETTRNTADSLPMYPSPVACPWPAWRPPASKHSDGQRFAFLSWHFCSFCIVIMFRVYIYKVSRAYIHPMAIHYPYL